MEEYDFGFEDSNESTQFEEFGSFIDEDSENHFEDYIENEDDAKRESLEIYLSVRPEFNGHYGESKELDVLMYDHFYDYLGFFEDEFENFIAGVEEVHPISEEELTTLANKFIINFYRMSDEVYNLFMVYLKEKLEEDNRELPIEKLEQLSRAAILGINPDDYRFVLSHLLSMDDFTCFDHVMLAYVHQLKRKLVFV